MGGSLPTRDAPVFIPYKQNDVLITLARFVFGPYQPGRIELALNPECV